MSNGYISNRAMYALIIIKRKLLENNDLALEASNSGSMVVAHHIDEIMSGLMRMESDLFDCQMTLKAEKEENEGFRELLGGYTADMLSDGERAKVRALVEEWEKTDSGDDEDAEKEYEAMDREPGAITFDEARRNGWR